MVGSVLLAAAVAVGTAACSSDHDSPKKVLDQYLAAFKAGDEAKVKSLVCARDKSGAVFHSDAERRSAATFEWTIGRERTHRAEAEVDFRLTRTAPTKSTKDETALLVSEHGQWRVCGLRSRG